MTPIQHGTLPVLFIIIVILTILILIYAFYKAKIRETDMVMKSVIFFTVISLLTGLLAANGFFMDTLVKPPRIMITFFPVIIVMVLMLSGKWKGISLNLSLKTLTLLHLIRIPVEIVLYKLWQQGLVPQLMTYEGKNFDIISGITAPVIFFLAFRNENTNRKLLLIWNIIALGLVLNVLILGVLSVPSPFQQIAFDQPNFAVLIFPYIWLPTIIVPVVIYCHLVSIIKLSNKLKNVI